MARFTSVDAYLAAQKPATQKILREVCAIIQRAVPKATLGISYQILAFKLNNLPVLYVAGWKEHYSVYPATEGMAEAFAKELAPYKVSKGTIRFALSEPVPAKLIERLAKFRAKLCVQAGKEKAAPKKKTRPVISKATKTRRK